VATRRTGNAFAAEAILSVALELTAEVGYDRRRDRRSLRHREQTIYRWWSGKAEVVLDAINSQASREIPVPDKGNLRADLLAFLSATFRSGRRANTREVLRALMAEAQLDDDFAAQLDERFLRQRRDVLAQILRRHPSELRDVPVELAVEVVFGVIWYRVLVTGGPANKALANHLVTLLAH
jgi:hypothetical protein